ncbi:MipA/OmpV family protein, partial [Methylobacterium sp. E-041]|uniref:MipA/OmpV family protein n=1 Tax=Methylobacterium sp. E-041 TaxID=2836573 RepID=UPI001FB933DC
MRRQAQDARPRWRDAPPAERQASQDATWAYTGYAGYSRILGSSGDSPLVRRPFGNPDQFLFGLKVDYSF